MMVGQRDHTGAKLDPLGAFASRGQKHFRRSDHLPTGGVMLAAPELVIAEIIELLDEVQIPAELQHRMLADRMMGGEKGSEFQARHMVSSGRNFSCARLLAGYVLAACKAIVGRPRRITQIAAMRAADGSLAASGCRRRPCSWRASSLRADWPAIAISRRPTVWRTTDPSTVAPTPRVTRDNDRSLSQAV